MWRFAERRVRLSQKRSEYIGHPIAIDDDDDDDGDDDDDDDDIDR